MNKKLPRVFANKIEKKIKNNKEVYISTNKQEQEYKNEKQNRLNTKSISQKINEIIKSKKYTYKVPVKIQLNDKEIVTNIIGKNQNNLITINNELIKINDIQNIEIYEKNE